MRYLLYYPMIHVPNSSYLEKALKIPGVSDEAYETVKEAIPETIDRINLVWYDFLKYLTNQENFTRVYFESWTYDNEVPCTDETGSGMFDCLDFLKNSGAKFEKTENESLLRYAHNLDKFYLNLTNKLGSFSKVVSPFYNMTNELGSRTREIYTASRIDKTLKEGERGLLLFGLDHVNWFPTFLEILDLKLEVYKPTIPEHIIC